MSTIIGPIRLSAKVYVKNDEKGLVGSADYDFPVGKEVTVEKIHKAIGESLIAAGEGFRLLDPDEFFNDVVIRERFGQSGNFAVPSSFDYDVEALTTTSLAAVPLEPKQEERPEGEDEEWNDGWPHEDDED